MARLSLNKSTLSKQLKQLKAYRSFLPSLDLKRQQLLAEQNKARRAVADVNEKIEQLKPILAKQMPMLAYESIDLKGLVQVTHIDLVEENVMGTRLPKLNRIDIAVQEYSFMAKPFWVDALVELLKEVTDLHVQRQIAEQRLTALEKATRSVTQRVNLFDKVLIPQTRKNIKKIEIYLADAERAGVVQAKLSKAGKETEA